MQKSKGASAHGLAAAERKRLMDIAAGRAAQVVELCCKAGRSYLAAEYVRRGLTVEDVRRLLPVASQPVNNAQVASDGWDRAVDVVFGKNAGSANQKSVAGTVHRSVIDDRAPKRVAKQEAPAPAGAPKTRRALEDEACARTLEIMDICKSTGQPTLASKFIASDLTAEQVRARLLPRAEERGATAHEISDGWSRAIKTVCGATTDKPKKSGASNGR